VWPSQRQADQALARPRGRRWSPAARHDGANEAPGGGRREQRGRLLPAAAAAAAQPLAFSAPAPAPCDRALRTPAAALRQPDQHRGNVSRALSPSLFPLFLALRDCTVPHSLIPTPSQKREAGVYEGAGPLGRGASKAEAPRPRV